MSKIYLEEIFNDLGPLSCYKIHFAKRSKNGTEPLDAFMRDIEEWAYWNRFSNGRDDFNRKYIFSLISFYPEKDTWLFGGIWEVLDKDFHEDNSYPYTIKLCEKYNNFIGRLKISYSHNERNVRNIMENYFQKFVVKEILSEVYSTYVFPGYKNLDVPFKTLENVIKKDNPAWKSALSLNGIYLITDINTGKKYVGSASGENGIWQRWSNYINDGHGGDVNLKKLVKEKDFEYVRENYKFTLLEIADNWSENDIYDRENYWKRVLLSRDEELGYNKN